jgi:hypothetical protein
MFFLFWQKVKYVLVPTFCEIIKNGPHILKMVKKKSHSFFVIKNGSFRLFFQGQIIECLLVLHTILILLLIIYKIRRNDTYILKSYGIFMTFFKI